MTSFLLDLGVSVQSASLAGRLLVDDLLLAHPVSFLA